MSLATGKMDLWRGCAIGAIRHGTPIPIFGSRVSASLPTSNLFEKTVAHSGYYPDHIARSSPTHSAH